MAITQTARLGVYRWSGGSDAFTRQQLDASHSNLEDRVAVFLSGSTAARPVASASNVRGFYLDTTTNILYYCAPDGAGFRWVSLNASAAPPSTLVPGDSANAGVADTAARSDHTHSMLPFAGLTGTGALAQVGTTANPGTSQTFAAGDHVHTLASNSVTAGTIAAGAISNANQFATGVVNTAAIGLGQVSRDRLAATERIPVGTIVPWLGTGTTAPSGWVLCDGQTTVPIGSELGAVLGTRFNLAGDLTSVARVPDLRSKFLRGAATTTSNGGAVGADSVTLASNQIPTHQHGIGTLAIAAHPDHAHSGSGLTASSVNIDHRHSIDHNHNSGTPITTTQGPVVARTSNFGAFIGPGSTNGVYGYAAATGTADRAVTQTATNWSSAPGINVDAHTGNSGLMNSNASHSHPVSGNTGGAVTPGTTTSTSLSHTITGSTGAPEGLAGGQQPISTVPAAITVNYLIKA